MVEAKVDRKSRGELHVETAKPLDDMNVFILMFRRDDFLAKVEGPFERFCQSKALFCAEMSTLETFSLSLSVPCTHSG